MKILAGILIVLAALIDPTKLGRINTLKAEAKKAYNSGDYKTAIASYRYLIDSLQVQEDEVSINLANAYFQLNDTTNALNQYQSLTQSSKNHIRSNAQQQLGVMANRAGKFEEALNHFKQAIKSDATNKDARYNYELLKKKLEEKKKQEEQNQDKQNQNKDQENKENKDQQEKNEDQKKEQDQKKENEKEQQEKDQQQKEQQEKEKQQQQQEEKDKEQEKKDAPRNPEQMKMSEEKARMILEAMKAQEKQYLQQNKRKATKPKDKGKPDW